MAAVQDSFGIEEDSNMVIRFLVEKEFKQIFRSKFLVWLFILLPTFMILMMPRAANQEIKGLKLGVVDNDRSRLSARLIQKLAASEYFTLTGSFLSYDDALDDVEAGNADVIMEIDDGFDKDLMTAGTSKVRISANAVNGVKAGLGSSYLSNIVDGFCADMRHDSGYGDQVGQLPSFNVAPYYRFNPHLDYKVFMVPAMMVMMLTLLSGFLPALNIVGEKERGTIEQMNVTPVGKLPFVISKLIPYWCVGFMVITYSMVLARLAYGLEPAGSLLTIYLFATIYIMVVSGMGLVISNYSATMQQALFVMFFFMIIFILMSGLFTPVASMPQWAQAITRLNPLRYFIEVMRMVYLKGSTMCELLPQLRALCTYAVAMGIWAIFSYRKTD